MPNIARSIIRDSLQAKPDEAIVIQAGTQSIDLATQVAVEAYKIGADPAIFLDTDEAFFGQFKYLSEDQLRKTSAHCLGIADYVDSYVYIGGVADPAPRSPVPLVKMSAMFPGDAAPRRQYKRKSQKQT